MADPRDDKPEKQPTAKCGECGYQISGLESGICPECGASFFVGGEDLLKLRSKLHANHQGRCKVCGHAVQPGTTKCPTCGCRMLGKL